jgi:hypothetical protein
MQPWLMANRQKNVSLNGVAAAPIAAAAGLISDTINFGLARHIAVGQLT